MTSMRSTLPGRFPALVVSITLALSTACGTPTAERPLAGPHAAEDGSEDGAQIFAPSGRAVILYNGPAGEAPPQTPLFDSVLAVTPR
jgi:hypothetical protein